jgi:NADH dehydrogenase
VVRRSGDILVTGATGLLGRQVCAQLGRAKRRHRALVRVTSNRDVLTGTKAWMCEGDLTRRSTLDAPLVDVKTVLHLAGVVRDKDPERNRAVHVDGTRNLIDAARAAGVARIVAVSSDTVLRTRRGVYAETKREAEDLLMAVKDIEVIVLRPPMMLGPGSPHLKSMLKAARLPILPLPGGLSNRRPVYVVDVAEAVIACMDLAREDLPAAPVDLPGPRSMAFGDLIRLVAERAGRPPPRVVTVPPGLLRKAARVAERLLKDPPLTVERLEGMAEEPEVDGRVARELLGWAPLALDEAIGRSLVDDGVV